MKMNCAKCGKRFDAEEHLYICPKCNHYHSQTGKRSQMTEKTASSELFEENSKKPLEKLKKKGNEFKDSTSGGSLLDLIDDIIAPDEDYNDAPEFIQTLNGEQKVYTAIKTEDKSSDDSSGSLFSKIRLIVIIIVGAAMLISALTNMFGMDSFNDWGDDDGYDYYSEYDAVEVSPGTPMTFETFTVYVGEAHEPEYEGLKASSGNKFVQIDFETESAYDYEDESLWTDVEVTYDTGNRAGNTYACYDGDLTSKISLQDQLREDGLVAEAHYSGNYFWIFEVPENAEEIELSVISYMLDNAELGEYVQDESFIMEIEIND